MDPQIESFLKDHHSAAMSTHRANGAAHTVRVGVAIIDGRLWSSGTQTRSRTKHLRRDPRSTLFVFDNEWRWLTLECTVSILEGPDAPQLNLQFMQVMQQGMPTEPGKTNWFGQQLTHEQFLETMVQEQRLIYEFDILRAYGMYAAMPTSSV